MSQAPDVQSELTQDPQGRLAYSYFVCGLHLRCDFELPELKGAAALGEAPDVTIRIGRVALEGEPVEFLDMHVVQRPDETLIAVEKVGRYAVRGGREIVVDPHSGASDLGVRLCLLGSALGALFHQRGLMPLHANAVETDGRAFAFAGPAGAGKSTLAASFAQRGYNVLCDDVCVVSFDGAARPVAWPGLPRLKLWKEALVALGKDPKDYSCVLEGYDKFHVPVDSYAAEGPFPLGALYVLSDASVDHPEGISRLTGVDAANAVVSNIYRRRFADLARQSPRYFSQAMLLLKQVPVYHVARVRGFDLFGPGVDKLEEHILAQTPDASGAGRVMQRPLA